MILLPDEKVRGQGRLGFRSRLEGGRSLVPETSKEAEHRVVGAFGSRQAILCGFYLLPNQPNLRRRDFGDLRTALPA